MANVKGRIIAVDCETSGLSSEDGQILSMTMRSIDVDSGEVLESLPIRIGYRGDVRPEPGAIATTGLNPFRNKGVTEAEAALAVSTFLKRHGGGDSPTLGHNVKFDQKWIRNLLARNGHDAHLVSLDVVDTYTEAAKALASGKLASSKFLQKAVRRSSDAPSTEDGRSDQPSTRPSLALGSVAKALDIAVDDSRTHDDGYDVDLSIEIWKKLGKPTKSEVSPFNNPYECERQFAGKVLRVREWDGINAEIRESKYYVPGTGAGEFEDAFGKKRYNSTMAIKVGNSDFTDLIERSAKGNVTQTAIDKVLGERSFSSPIVLGIEEDSSESVASIKTAMETVLPKLQEAFGEKRRKVREQQYMDRLAAASSSVFQLDEPSNRETLISADNESLIPALAAELAPLSELERSKKISAIANSQPVKKGTVWAHALKVMAERYGYRNGIPGFENARRAHFLKTLPEKIEARTVTKGLDDVESPVKKAMEKNGGAFIRLTSGDGATKVSYLNENEAVIGERQIDHPISDAGFMSAPGSETVALAIAELVGCSKSAANSVRKGFSALADNDSLSALKRQLACSATKAAARGDTGKAAALSETLADLGTDYSDFLSMSLKMADANRLHSPTLQTISDASDVEDSIADMAEAVEEAESFANHEKAQPEATDGLKSEKFANAEDGETAANSETETKTVPRRFNRKAMEQYLEESDNLKKKIAEAYSSPAYLLADTAKTNEAAFLANLANPALDHKVIDMQAYVLSSQSRRAKTIATVRDGAMTGQMAVGDSVIATSDNLAEPDDVSSDPIVGNLAGLTAASSEETATGSDDATGERRRGRKSEKLAEKAAEQYIAQCKVCRRWVKGKNVVAGMGPVCARRLASWLHKPDNVPLPEESSKRFKKVGELKESGVYPIMIVRDTSTGRTFAADILRKEKDGRYLVIDLSQIASESERDGETGRGRSETMRETVKVYLEPSNHEVAKVYGDSAFKKTS